jgi:signal recognition particle receptor subunit beta
MVILGRFGTQRTLRIVYGGPAGGGKTTNVQELHRRLNPAFPADRSELNGTDAAFRFDLLMLFLARPGGPPLIVKVYTLPDPEKHPALCEVLLAQAQGIVFVADSGRGRQADNLGSFDPLRKRYMAGKTPGAPPVVVQFNKRDLPDRIPEAEVFHGWRTERTPVLFATARAGEGVLETFEEILRRVHRACDLARHGMAERSLLRAVGLEVGL